MSSSSAVLTPGATAAAAACRAAATTWPASHITANCAGVLICMPGSRILRILPPDPTFTVPASPAEFERAWRTSPGQLPAGPATDRGGSRGLGPLGQHGTQATARLIEDQLAGLTHP